MLFQVEKQHQLQNSQLAKARNADMNEIRSADGAEAPNCEPPKKETSLLDESMQRGAKIRMLNDDYDECMDNETLIVLATCEESAPKTDLLIVLLVPRNGSNSSRTHRCLIRPSMAIPDENQPLY